MEVNITEKYAKKFLDGKLAEYLKVTPEGNFFTGSIKFRIVRLSLFFIIMEISFWMPESDCPIFIVKEKFNMKEGAVVTFDPFTIQVGSL